MIKYTKLIFVLFLLFPVILSAAGTTSFNFLQMNIGSRAQGMGNAFTAVPSDINTIYYNPAGIGFSYRPSIMFFHAQLYEDIAVENFSVIYPNLNNFTLSFGLSYLHLPEIEKYDINSSTGEPIPFGQSFQFYDFVPQAGVAYRMNKDLSVGLQFKFLQERIDDITASGIGFDIGALYKTPLDFLSIGASMLNLGPQVTYEREKENLPLTYRLGLAYQIPDYMVTFAFDAVKTQNEEWRFYPGMEVEFLNSIALRAGYQFQQDLGAGYNVGMGFTLMDNYQLNYVFSPYGILGNTHKAEITINFGDIYPGKKTPEVEYQRDYSRYYELTSGQIQNRYISYFLPVPAGLQSRKEDGQLILTWSPVNLSDARYNIYLEVPSKKELIRINSVPQESTEFVFSPTATDWQVKFYVSLVKENRESELSEPLKVKISR